MRAAIGQYPPGPSPAVAGHHHTGRPRHVPGRHPRPL